MSGCCKSRFCYLVGYAFTPKFAHAFIRTKPKPKHKICKDEIQITCTYFHLISYLPFFFFSIYVIISYTTWYILNWNKKELCADKQNVISKCFYYLIDKFCSVLPQVLTLSKATHIILVKQTLRVFFEWFYILSEENRGN